MKSWFRAAGIVLVALSALSGLAADRYVSTTGTNDSLGGFLTWSGAATNIQAAVDKAANGETVWVADGQYSSTGLNAQVVSITKGLSLRGFGGDPANVIIDGNATNRGVYIRLTTTNYVLIDSITITNCIIGGKGAGIYLLHDTVNAGTAVVQNCVITGNRAGHGVLYDQWAAGGGMISMGMQAGTAFRTVVSNCTFSGNRTQSRRYCSGGGAFFSATQLTMQDCRVIGNEATCTNTMDTGRGGGVGVNLMAEGSVIRNCRFEGNMATNSWGGGLMVNDGSIGLGIGGYTGLVVESCVIVSNWAAYAGGVHIASGTNNVLRNCLITLNRSLPGSYYGGGMMWAGSTNLIENCTIVSNWAGQIGAGVRQIGGAGEIRNSVIYHNWRSAPAIDNYSVNAGPFTVNNCVITPTNALTGSGNIGTPPPAFESMAAGDFRLKHYSPGVDAGIMQGWMSAATDLAGQPRVGANNQVDIGAYETSYAPHPGYYAAQNGQTPVLPYTNWVTAASNIQDAVSIYDINYPSTVWVGAGRYFAPAVPPQYFGPNVVVLDKALTLRSSNGVPASTIIDGGGATRGVAVSNVNAVAPYAFIIDGFTIANGYATNYGAGILASCQYGAITVQVQNCTIEGNTVFANPGGPCGGGGLAANNTAINLTVSNCTIRGNVATNSDPLNALTGLGGGGVYVNGRNLITDCVIASNVWGTAIPNSNNGGGGLYLSAGTTHTIRNTLLFGNSGYGNGGAIYMFVASGVDQTLTTLNLINCSLVGNPVGYGIYLRRAYCTINVLNSILYTNAYQNIAASVGPETAVTNLFMFNSCIAPTGGITGVLDASNTTNDPRLVNYVANNCRLTPGSPCINTGMNQAWMTGARDVDGNPRISPVSGGTVDMGAYEFPIQSGSIFTVR